MAPLVQPMQFHQYMCFPDVTKVELTSEEVEFVLELLYRSHSTLVGLLGSPAYTEEEKQLAYKLALSSEKLYARTMAQLNGKNNHPSLM